jgi:hypothetical protein
MNNKSVYKKRMTQEIIVVDKDTGEVIDVNQKKHTYLANTNEEFFFGYSSLVGIFMNMSQAEIRIFGYLLRYDKGVQFDISKKIRLHMASTIDINERTILNTIPSLLEKNLIYQFEDTGLYQLNPRHAFNGGHKQRNNALKVIIELGCKNC